MNIKSVVKIGVLTLSITVAGCGGGSSSGGGIIGPQGADASAVSWYSTAQPLIERYCASCHTEGSNLAPFPLDNYEQVYNKLPAIAYSLESDTMPLEGYLDLTGDEVELLLDWIDDGAPEGDPSQTPIRFTDLGYTYHRDIRALVEKHCVGCHVDGGVAPFSLDSYDKVQQTAAAAAFALESGDMPPWPPTEGYSRFTYERAVPAEDKFKMLNWLNGNLSEGNPADYVPPEEFSVDPPDFNIRVKLPVPYTPTLRPDDHRCFAIDWPLDEVSYVTAVDVIPDQVAEVHHVIVNIIDPADVHHYVGASGADGNPGWPCLLSGGLPGAPLPRQIGGWVPGTPTGSAPEGTGIGIHPDSILVVQMHYNTLVAEPTPDQSTILIATTDSVERPSNGFLFTDPRWLQDGGMPIPAGEPDVHHSFEVPARFLAQLFGAPAGISDLDEWVIHNGFLHMHNLATSGRTTLVRADGTEQVILDIRDWDFNWQSTYILEKELLVRPGDNIRLECIWDNTDENQTVVNGEQLPARDVQWGDGTGDEMCLMNILMTQKKEGYDYSYAASVHIESPSHRQQFKAGDLVPLELLFNNFTLHEPGAHSGGGSHDEHTGMGDDHSAVYSGHYHVYLDTDDDDDADHLTAWDAKYYYQLPDDIEPGVHNLRVSLRGEDHHGLGIEHSVDIEVVEATVVDSEPLIDVDAWTFQSAAQDSLSAHRPASVECPDNSWYNEDGALEVETGFCNYLSLSQPSLTGIEAGDDLHLVLWHGNLAFSSQATAHVSITVDGESVWSENVEIPSEAEIFDLRIPVNFDAPQGSKVEYHLHNHGYNTWTLLQLDVER
jgi:mono/diheme cytochrome c family protein